MSGLRPTRQGLYLTLCALVVRHASARTGERMIEKESRSRLLEASPGSDIDLTHAWSTRQTRVSGAIDSCALVNGDCVTDQRGPLWSHKLCRPQVRRWMRVPNSYLLYGIIPYIFVSGIAHPPVRNPLPHSILTL